MAKKEPQNCWEFWDCKTKEDCSVYQTKSGRECWFLASNFCPHIKQGNFEHCWECPWYKKLNPNIDKN